MKRFQAQSDVPSLLLIGALALCCPAARADVAGFEDLGLGANGYWNGADYSGGFVDGGVIFANSYTDWGGGYDSWFGWAYSSMTDSTTPGYGNQYSAITGGGQDGSHNYALAFQSFYAGDAPPKITAAQNTLFQSAYLTNSTYAYLTMRDGEPIFGAKKFGGDSGTDPDWFKLTITGRDAADAVLGSVDVYLADFRPAAERTDNPVKENYILNQWRQIDLAGLGNAVRSLSLSFASSDNDEIYGMNTPAYVALDTLTAVSVGEDPPPELLTPDVQNHAALSLAGGTRELGHITGNGALTVQPGTTLVADSIVQDTLVIAAGGAVVIRESGAPQASAVPEPGLLALLLGGGAAIAVRVARRRRRAGIARRQ